MKRVAEAWAELMAGLGFDRYIAQGGDWGSFVSTWLGLVDPEHVAGVHLNMAVGFPGDGEITDAEAVDLTAMGDFLANGCAYQEIQGKNPQTLAYGLNDSPPVWPDGSSRSSGLGPTMTATCSTPLDNRRSSTTSPPTGSRAPSAVQPGSTTRR